MKTVHKNQQKLLELAKRKDLTLLGLREIGREIGVKNPQTIKYHLNKLLEQGVSLKPELGLRTDTMHLVSVPIVGSANCGPATIFAEDRIEDTLKISPRLLNTSEYKNLFALRAVGDSMNNATVDGNTIENNDYVIVDSSKRGAEDAKYVVAVVDGLANIKRIQIDRPNMQIALLSESTNEFSPIYIHLEDQIDALIAGEVVQVVKGRAS